MVKVLALVAVAISIAVIAFVLGHGLGYERGRYDQVRRDLRAVEKRVLVLHKDDDK